MTESEDDVRATLHEKIWDVVDTEKDMERVLDEALDLLPTPLLHKLVGRLK